MVLIELDRRAVDELKAFLFLKMIEDMLKVLDSLEVYSMDSLGVIMETMADVTKDTEGLSINARVGVLTSVYCSTPYWRTKPHLSCYREQF